MEETRRVSQSLNITKQKNRTMNKQVQLLNESRERYAIGEMRGAIPFDGDVDAPGEVSDEDDQEESREKKYCELSHKAKPKTHPDHFKECIIESKEPNNAICLMCDPQDPVREMKLSGRLNSGQAVSGDTVAVKIIMKKAYLSSKEYREVLKPLISMESA